MLMEKAGRGIGRRGFPRPERWLIEAVVLGVLVLVTISAVSGWRSADASNEYPASLLSLPPPEPPGGFMTLTAGSPNLTRRSWEPPGVTYVSAGTVSTGPDVVSVHPIDFSTWAAVALGSNGRCYAVLAYEWSPSDGQDYYGRFSRHTPCRGREATRATVNQSSVPE
jgi:hypothetical protein